MDYISLFKEQYPDIRQPICSFYDLLLFHYRLYGRPTLTKNLFYNYPTFIEPYFDVRSLINDDLECGYLRAYLFNHKKKSFEELLFIKEKDIYYDHNQHMFDMKSIVLFVLNLEE